MFRYLEAMDLFKRDVKYLFFYMTVATDLRAQSEISQFQNN